MLNNLIIKRFKSIFDADIEPGQVTLAMHPDAPRFFAIDNFDQAMHPRLARDAAGLFCEAVLNNSRRPAAFFTTHNPLVLDGLNLSDDRIRLFALDRNSEGHTGIWKVLLSPELLAEGAKGIPLSRLWVMGRLWHRNSVSSSPRSRPAGQKKSPSDIRDVRWTGLTDGWKL